MHKSREGTSRRRAHRATAGDGLVDRGRLPRAHERASSPALRTKLREHGARFAVVKNTLTRRAAEAAGAEALLALLDGPTAIAFVEADGDPVAVAKALADAADGHEGPRRCVAASWPGAAITAAEVEELAKLPPVDVLQEPARRRDRGAADAARRVLSPRRSGIWSACSTPGSRSSRRAATHPRRLLASAGGRRGELPMRSRPERRSACGEPEATAEPEACC